MALYALAWCWEIDAGAAPGEYEVEGVFEQTIYRRPPFNVKGEFIIFVRDRSWLIQTLEYMQNSTFALKREIGSTNGTEIFEIVRGTQQENAPPAATKEGAARPNRPGANPIATAMIASNAVPVGQLDGAVVGHLWLMLASHGYWNRLTTNLLTPVYDVSASPPGNPNLKFKAEWKLIGGPGSLPMNVTYFFANGSTSAIYRAIGTTNVNGIAYPSKFLFEYYAGGNIAHVTKRANVTVMAIRAFCSLVNLLPEITSTTLVADRRVKQAENPLKSLDYVMAASERWHTVAEAQKLHGAKKKPPKASPVMVPLIGTLLCAPLLVWAAYSWRRWRKAR